MSREEIDRFEDYLFCLALLRLGFRTIKRIKEKELP